MRLLFNNFIESKEHDMKKLNILFAASECTPFIKTGGLADVAGSLPSYVNTANYEMRIVMPKYSALPKK